MLITSLLVLLVLLVGCRAVLPRIGDSAAGGQVELANGRQQLADCPDTPNCSGSQSTRPSQQLPPLTLPGSLDNALQRIEQRLRTEPGYEIVEQDRQYLHATYTSRWMGFVDDVEFLLDRENKVVQVRSASRLGYSDLGANARRIERLRQTLSETGS